MDIELIKELISALEKSGLDKMTIREKGGFEISLERKEAIPTTVAPLQPPQRKEPPVHGAHPLPAESIDKKVRQTDTIDLKKCIKAPMVGTFYAAASPEEPNFVKVGDQVKAGDTICIIEAMKVMNEIKADKDAKIKEIHVQNAEPVEYGQPLFTTE